MFRNWEKLVKGKDRKVKERHPMKVSFLLDGVLFRMKKFYQTFYWTKGKKRRKVRFKHQKIWSFFLRVISYFLLYNPILDLRQKARESCSTFSDI